MDDKELQTIYAKRNDSIRRSLYAELADPIFFKWQRGEATKQEWLDAVAEVDSKEII